MMMLSLVSCSFDMQLLENLGENLCFSFFLGETYSSIVI